MMIPPDIILLSTLPEDIERAVPALMTAYGTWVYLIFFAIIFCETGLVFAPFLPGDPPLLFLPGFPAAGGAMDPVVVIGVLAAAVILGDSVNYRIGTSFGRQLPERRKCFVLSPACRDHPGVLPEIWEKYHRPCPVRPRYRSVAPFFAGIVRREYPVFLACNTAGGLLWVSGFVTFGYLIASLPVFQARQKFFLWAILLISIGIILFMVCNILKTFRECCPSVRDGSEQTGD